MSGAEHRRVARRVILRGKVQGVGFRWWTVSRARDLEIGGWVRNRSDGSVEAVFLGSDEAVGTMIRSCHAGPPSARVDAVEMLEAMPEEASEGDFEQRETV